MSHQTTVICVIAALAAAVPAFAQQDTRPMVVSTGLAFDRNDINQDGYLDRAEFKNTPRAQPPNDAAQAWRDADANRDGYVSRQEFLVPIRQPYGTTVPTQSGRPMVVSTGLGFDRNDTNHDGYLDRAEFRNTPRARAPNDADRAWWDADQNQDGYVSREEFMVPIPAPLPPSAPGPAFRGQ